MMTTTTPRPATMPLNPAGLPDDPLLREARFVGWRWSWNEQKGKWDKPPLRLIDGRPASVTDERDWATRARALAAVGRLGFDGIGLVLTAGCGVTGIDLDACRDAETGAIADWARASIDRFASYWEPSASGTGIRIFIRATLPPGRRRIGHIEMYDSGRYLTINGNAGPGASRRFEPRQAELDAWHAELFPAQPAHTPVHGGHPPAAAGDQLVLDRARAAANGGKFSRLYDAGAWEAEGYPSRSEARQALVSELAFWCRDDPGQAERLFEASALYDAKKWPRERGRVLQIAYRRREFFDWARVASPPPSTVDTPPGEEDDKDRTIAELRAKLAEKDRRLAAIHELMTCEGMTPIERVIAYGVSLEAASAQSRQPDDAPAPELPINQTAIACNVHVSRQAVGGALKRWSERGHIRKETRQTGQFTRDGDPISETLLRMPAQTLTDNLVMATTWTRPAGTKHVGGNGRRCPNCQGTETKKTVRTVTVRTTTIVCAGCGHVHQTTTKEIGKAETYVQFGDLATDIPVVIDIPGRRQLAPVPPSTVDTPPVAARAPEQVWLLPCDNAATPPPRDYTISLVEAADRRRAASYGGAAPGVAAADD